MVPTTRQLRVQQPISLRLLSITYSSPQPTVTAVAPNAGPTGGGTSVTITGTNLAGATAVKFGATAASGYTVISNTQIVATAPAGSAGTVDITVTGPAGTSTTSAADQYTYISTPTVTSVSPTSGPGGGGTTVTITGTGFAGATAVTFGGTAATGYTVNSASQITATAPAGSGTVDIRVTTPGGTSATTAADQYTYVPAPTVTSVSPTSGPTAGGTTVIITGTGFAFASGSGAVKFGAANAIYTINSNTQITATAPGNSAGTYDVTVTTAGGTSATSAADQYTYVSAPMVTAVSPNRGPTAGGTTVIITGSGFAFANPTGAVKFGATNATYTINSNTQITATSPANAAGTYDITVTTPGGTSATTAADQYTYVSAPTVTSISPTAGPTAGGTTVTITGTGFALANPTGAVKFGATNATYTINSNTQITVTSPANAAGTYDITVTTPGGTSATTAADQYTYVSAPTVTSISPTAGPTAGGTTVTITGTGFASTAAVTFGGTAATGFVVDSTTQITATAPAGSGTVDIRVTTVGGTSATSAADQFTYVPAPAVTAVSPSRGPTAGGTTVTITGTDFAGAAAVTFGGTAATGYTVNSASQITATAPAGSGTVDIRVTTVGGTSATTAADQYTYVPAPTVTSISPTAGPTAGGTTVTITGTGFALANPTGAVKFGATNATYTINSNTQITVTSPVNSAGTYDITVTNPGGTSATNAADQYTYVAPPVGSSFTYGSVVPYNDGSNTTLSFSLSGNVSNTPTSYAVGSATTAQGGSVSVNSNGDVTYTPPIGYRNANDSFTYTATNLGGTSSPATVTLTIGNPNFSVSLPSNTATVGRAYNTGNASVTLSGGSSPYTVNTITGLPAGMVDSGGGIVNGTPTEDGTFTVTVSITDGSTGAGPFTSNATATLTVVLPPVPVVTAFTAPALAYNTGSASATTFSLAAQATNLPTGYAVGSATTANGGSVSIDSAGLVSYTPPVGFRGNDSFTFTATNQGGTSSPATVTVPVSDPVFRSRCRPPPARSAMLTTAAEQPSSSAAAPVPIPTSPQRPSGRPVDQQCGCHLGNTDDGWQCHDRDHRNRQFGWSWRSYRHGLGQHQHCCTVHCHQPRDTVERQHRRAL